MREKDKEKAVRKKKGKSGLDRREREGKEMHKIQA